MDNKKKKSLGVRKFLKGKSGRNFLLFLEILLVFAFLAQPDLYYDPTAANFFNRFYADSLTICGGLWVILVFLTVKKVKLRPQINRRLTWAVGLLTPFVAFLWLEFYNDMQFWVPVFDIPPLYLLLDLLIYYVIYLFEFFVT